MKRLLLWYGLLSKRLLRKPSFLILLLCVPLLAGAMALAVKQEKSFVSVAVVCATDDPAARRSADRLLNSASLVRCEEFDSEAEARAAVMSAQADAAWIFRDEFADELLRFVSNRGTRGAVLIVEREETVFLRLAREQLAAAIYPEVSRMLFRSFLIERLGASITVAHLHRHRHKRSQIIIDHHSALIIHIPPILLYQHHICGSGVAAPSVFYIHRSPPVMAYPSFSVP